MPRPPAAAAAAAAALFAVAAPPGAGTTPAPVAPGDSASPVLPPPPDPPPAGAGGCPVCECASEPPTVHPHAQHHVPAAPHDAPCAAGEVCCAAESCAGPAPASSGIPMFLSIIMGCVLLFLSGCFSGLTLGLLGLDNIALTAIADAPEQKIEDGDPKKAEKLRANRDKEAALKIIPLRKSGNLLLCTLLLGNVMVNVMIPILLADLTGGLYGFIASTVFIVIFGEIVPQATCSRYALQIGALSIPLVSFFKCLLFIFAYPISVILDKLLGTDVGQLYDNEQLQRLILIHLQQGLLADRECRIVQRGLQMQKTDVGEIMTYQKNVFWLDAEQELTEAKLVEIWQKGHSRIPVLECGIEAVHRSNSAAHTSGMDTAGRRRPGPRDHHEDTGDDYSGTEMSPALGGSVSYERREQCIGLLYTKDLITVRPEDRLTVRQVLQFYTRGEPLTVDKSEKLDKVLDRFRRKKVHLALVEEITSRGGGDPTPDRLGIVTLEDIMEHLVGEEFVDEHDVFEDVGAQHLKKTRRHQIPIVAFRERKTRLQTLEAVAVANFLRRSAQVFAHLEQDLFVHLLCDRAVHRQIDGYMSPDGRYLPDPDTPEGRRAWLYRKGRPLDVFTFVLSGTIEIQCGDDDFVSTIGPYHMLGLRVLEADKGGDAGPISDFSACVREQSVRVLQLTWDHIHHLNSRSPARREGRLWAPLHKETPLAEPAEPPRRPEPLPAAAPPASAPAPDGPYASPDVRPLGETRPGGTSSAGVESFRRCATLSPKTNPAEAPRLPPGVDGLGAMQRAGSGVSVGSSAASGHRRTVPSVGSWHRDPQPRAGDPPGSAVETPPTPPQTAPPAPASLSPRQPPKQPWREGPPRAATNALTAMASLRGTDAARATTDGR